MVVAHAGMKEEMQGRGSGEVREFALYGETTGETDDSDCRSGTTGPRNIAGGRWWFMDTRRSRSRNGSTAPSISIPVACSVGSYGLRYPEKELVSVPALQTYYEPVKPFCRNLNSSEVLTAQQSSMTCWTWRTFWESGSRHEPATEDHNSGRERDGCAGGYEPLRGQSEMAYLPAADDVSCETSQRDRLSRISG